MTPLEDAMMERQALIAQEVNHHNENVNAELRRFQRELGHIDKTFALRLGLD